MKPGQTTLLLPNEHTSTQTTQPQAQNMNACVCVCVCLTIGDPSDPQNKVMSLCGLPVKNTEPTPLQQKLFCWLSVQRTPNTNIALRKGPSMLQLTFSVIPSIELGYQRVSWEGRVNRVNHLGSFCAGSIPSCTRPHPKFGLCEVLPALLDLLDGHLTDARRAP